jgi:hypothetical protein
VRNKGRGYHIWYDELIKGQGVGLSRACGFILIHNITKIYKKRLDRAVSPVIIFDDYD